MEFLSYRNALPRSKWPKVPPALSPQQLEAREQYMKLWHEELPNKYRVIEEFNHGFIAKLPIGAGWKTLEIGAGLGSHLRYENLTAQEYYCMEYREEFCKEIRKILPESQVFRGDIQLPDTWSGEKFYGCFDRLIAIHVLEHLSNLPVALDEIGKLLKPTGVLDIVIPCEGGLAHTLARKISAERLFRKNFHMSFTPIHLNEHVNSYGEIVQMLKRRYKIDRRTFFPLRIPFENLNLCVGFRLTRR